MKLKIAMVGLALVLVVVLIELISIKATKRRTRTFEFNYTAIIKEVPAGAKEINLWLPYPTSDENQTVEVIKVLSPYPWKINKDSEYGNSILHVPIRSPKESSLKVEMQFKVSRHEYVRKDFSAHNVKNSNGTSTDLQRWLMPDKMVPIDDNIKKLALAAVDGKSTTDLEKARAIYDYSVSTLKYDKSGTGWGRGDIYYACDVKRGNCTDFHAVFTGFCRAMGIPAKFEIGFPLPEARGQGQIAGYHCWSEFYLKGYGWVPVDCSEASKNPAKKEYFFGAHDENRVLFTRGRDLTLSPSQKGEPLNYFIYPYVEVDGKTFNNVEKEFRFKDLP